MLSNGLFNLYVPGQGFEPRFRDPKSLVLPLDDPGVTSSIGVYIVSAKTRYNTSADPLGCMYPEHFLDIF